MKAIRVVMAIVITLGVLMWLTSWDPVGARVIALALVLFGTLLFPLLLVVSGAEERGRRRPRWIALQLGTFVVNLGLLESSIGRNGLIPYLLCVLANYIPALILFVLPAVSPKHQEIAKGRLEKGIEAGGTPDGPGPESDDPIRSEMNERLWTLVSECATSRTNQEDCALGSETELLSNVSGLLQKGANPHWWPSDRSQSPWMMANQMASLPIVGAMIEAGARVNARGGTGKTALALAAEKGNLGLAEMLITEGANVDRRSKNGRTPLMEAALNGHGPMVQFLLDRGANPRLADFSSPPFTALRLAQEHECWDAAQVLVEWGANPRLAGYWPLSPVTLGPAPISGGCEATQISGDETATTDYADPAPRQDRWFRSACEDGNTEVVSDILARGSDVNIRFAGGRTGLILAARNGNTETVQLLLSRGADPNLAAHDGGTALMLACITGHGQVVRLLLSSGAEVNKRDEIGYCALIWAAKNRRNELVGVLLKHEANVDSAGKDGQTPLIWAARLGELSMVEELLRAGARLDKKDNLGHDALWWARKLGHLEVEKRLFLELAKREVISES